MVTVWWSTAHLIHYCFLNLLKLLYLRHMLSKLMRCTKKCNACSRHWSTERAQFFSATRPDCTLHNQGFKNWTNGATKFCLICHIHLTSHLPFTSLSILTNFCRENNSTTSKRQENKNAFQGFVESQSTDFYATGISKLISHWKKCVDCNGFYFD